MFQGSNLPLQQHKQAPNQWFSASLSSASVHLFPWSQPAFLPVHGAVRCTHSLTTVAVRIPYSQYSVSVVAFEMCVLTLLYLQVQYHQAGRRGRRGCRSGGSPPGWDGGGGAGRAWRSFRWWRRQAGLKVCTYCLWGGSLVWVWGGCGCCTSPENRAQVRYMVGVGV